MSKKIEVSEMDRLILNNIVNILNSEYTEVYSSDSVRFEFIMPSEIKLQYLVEIYNLRGLLTADIRIKEFFTRDQYLTKLIVKIR